MKSRFIGKKVQFKSKVFDFIKPHDPNPQLYFLMIFQFAELNMHSYTL